MSECSPTADCCPICKETAGGGPTGCCENCQPTLEKIYDGIAIGIDRMIQDEFNGGEDQ